MTKLFLILFIGLTFETVGVVLLSKGLKSLEVLIATYLSARDGKRVALPLEY